MSIMSHYTEHREQVGDTNFVEIIRDAVGF
jgi:hypothetical protein